MKCKIGSTLRIALGFPKTFRVFDACASNSKSPVEIDISITVFILVKRQIPIFSNKISTVSHICSPLHHQI